MKLLSITVIALVLGSNLWGQAIIEGYKNLLVPKSPSKKAITKVIDEFRALKPGEPYLSWPSAEEPFEAGELKQSFLNYGLAAHKMYRFVAGLDTKITLNPKWNDIAQHAAVLLNRRGFITHTPEFEKSWGMDDDFFAKGYKGAFSSNLGMTEDDLGEFVGACILDSDITNIKELGHRRWHLFPSLNEIGFGYFDRFAVTRVFDLDNRPKPSELAYVAYPPAGYMPIEFYCRELAWHFELYDLPQFGGLKWDRLSLKVEVKRVRDGKVWTFTKAKKDGVFEITSPPIGRGVTLIFRPDEMGFVTNGDQFEVSISGISDGRGKPLNIDYRTEFFSKLADLDPKAQTTRPPQPTIFAAYMSGGKQVKVSGQQIKIGDGKNPLTEFSLWVDTKEGVVPATIKVGGQDYASGETIKAASGFNSFGLKGNLGGNRFFVNLVDQSGISLKSQGFGGYTYKTETGKPITAIEISIVGEYWEKTLLGE